MAKPLWGCVFKNQAGDISMEASIKLLVYGGASNLRVVLKDCKVWRFKLMIYMVVEECILMSMQFYFRQNK
jgi:hypothetical protein